MSSFCSFVYSVSCVHAKKRLVKKSDWIAGNTSAVLLDSLVLTCLNTTEYDIDISDYICTPPCITPYNTSQLYPTWSDTARPELGDTVKYRCNGSQIVSKADFELGNKEGPSDEVSVTCTFTGQYQPGLITIKEYVSYILTNTF